METYLFSVVLVTHLSHGSSAGNNNESAKTVILAGSN